MESDVFEGEGGAVEELEKVYLFLFLECDEGRDVGSAEGGVGAVDDVFEVCWWDLGRGDVLGEDVEGEFFEGEAGPVRGPVLY